jgi:hypothetical protein
MESVERSVAAATLVFLMFAAESRAQTPEAPPLAGPANDTARFLAGMEPLTDPALKELTRDESWQHHARFFDTAWADLDKKQLSKIRDWTRTATPDAISSKSTLFYMFSGPDFLYANTFYPQANTYILCGIEPIGPMPDVSKLSPNLLGGELRSLQSSLNSVLSFSFFITKEMKDDLKNHVLSGTLPVLYIFLERSGMTLGDVSFVSVDENGTCGPALPGSTAPGVRIHFVANGSSVQQTLYYFSTDISNEGLAHSGFLQFCKTQAPANSFVKSASYLMHEKEFSSVRDFLLENSNTLLEDDSGVPCSFFPPEMWNMTLYGAYPGPISLFKKYGQPLLADYYKTSRPAPLDFGIGYRHHANESTLMVFNRKSHPNGEPKLQATATEAPLRAVMVPEQNLR